LARRVGRTFHAPPKLDEFRLGPYPEDEVARCVKGSRQRKVGPLRGGGLKLEVIELSCLHLIEHLFDPIKAGFPQAAISLEPIANFD
jgi:hypothetical protein